MNTPAEWERRVEQMRAAGLEVDVTPVTTGPDGSDILKYTIRAGTAFDVEPAKAKKRRRAAK